MRKRLLIVFALATMLIAAISMCAFADSGEVEIYDSSISNYIRINENETKSGEVGGGTYSYDPINKVLTLSNVKINASTWECGIVAGFDITVKIEGNCKISANPGNNCAIWADSCNLTLTGSGTLDIENFTGINIYVGDGSLILDGASITATGTNTNAINADNVTFKNKCNVNLTSKSSTIFGSKNVTFNLAEGGKVEATCTSSDKAAVRAIEDIEILTNNRITTPENGIKYKSEYWNIANADNTPANHVVIEGPAAATKTGADTFDSSDIALFGIMGILALCGAGFVYKRREN